MTPHKYENQTLSVREFEIAQLVAAELSNKQIASCLGISIRTVRNHITHIIFKLRRAGRVGVAVWYINHYSKKVS